MTQPEHVLLPHARRLDLVVQAGDDRPAVIDCYGSETSPQDVSGWSARASVCVSRTQTVPILHTWSTADGTLITSGTGAALLMDGSAWWQWTQGEYDLLLIDPDGYRFIEAYGSVTVRPVVTR